MKNLILLFLPFYLFSCAGTDSVSVQSPNQEINVVFGVDGKKGNYYTVNYRGESVISPSFIGFQLENGRTIGHNVKIVSSSEKQVKQSWEPVYGERAEIPDVYNQTTVRLKETVSPGNEFEITFRVYNEGVAFNFKFLPQEGQQILNIQKELTEFSFPGNYKCWVSDKAQSEYRKVRLNKIDRPAERPLVVEAGDRFVALGEARLVDFSRMKLCAGEKQNSLVAALHGSPTITLPYESPWRTIMVGGSPGELLENNYFLQNLNAPCEIGDVSWIKPGKVIREVTLTTLGGLASVDFAVKNGLQYVEFDAGWYGNEYDDNSDASTITVDPKRSPGPLDLHRVIEYGNSKGVGVILYVNRRALEKQIDKILPLYKSWGVKGVKYGFVQVGSQQWTAWLHQAIKKAAENQLLVDVHDEYRPTGFSRTYPNLMTQEGIRGDEESPTNGHTLVTLFTRMLAGAGDNTICYFAPRVTEKMGNHVSQLAKAVMMYSPLQFLYWYDRPPNSADVIGGVPGSKGFILNVPELAFFKEMPTVWDEVKVLEGNIGEFATVARKSGDNWFLGSLTGGQAHRLNPDLSFLDANANYEATIFTHDSNVAPPTHVKIEKKNVTSNSVLDFEIAANSGLAICFKKI